MKTLVLASASPRRKELLSCLGLPFIVDPSTYEENMNLNHSPHELAKVLSLGKVQDIARKHTNALVIGADTLIAFSGKVLGKPHTSERALEILLELNGNQHSVFTGYTVIDTDTHKTVSEVVETVVYFKNVTREEIEQYVETGEPLDKAGAYAIQGRGAFLVERIEGDLNNVIGLPTTELSMTLQKFEVGISLGLPEEG